MKLTRQQCDAIVRAAATKAEEIGSPSSIAIMDEGRNLMAFSRMDSALLGSIEIAIGKAYTARSLNSRTSDVARLVQPGEALYGLEVTHRHPLVVFGGGVPLMGGGEVIGSVGVAGGTVEQDEEVAMVGAAAVMEER